MAVLRSDDIIDRVHYLLLAGRGTSDPAHASQIADGAAPLVGSEELLAGGRER